MIMRNSAQIAAPGSRELLIEHTKKLKELKEEENVFSKLEMDNLLECLS